ncbi:hypothetical protein [Marinobacter sp. F3R08]|uniref:hypothetical protein n=1 Tax=Marinobacter sp. F3R08 TaxID=2841559 RepID=UPI001C09747C|nr:hypothetical protein [Marinobacter sp. F3R08]MBU2953707.1 hypothetical protein [Marinobacter sp. F3R08]
MTWLSQNYETISALTSIGTLFIWLFYAQLLYSGYKRQRRPRIIINRGRRKDADALCIISNMSAEPVFVEYIIAELETNQGSITIDVTDYEREYDHRASEDKNPGAVERTQTPIPERVRDNTRQGPLHSGDFLHIGSFREIIRRVASTENIELDGQLPAQNIQFKRLTIKLIGVYGSEDLPTGAERSFSLVVHDTICDLAPETWDTQHQASWLQRRKLRKTLKKLNESNDCTYSPIQKVS